MTLNVKLSRTTPILPAKMTRLADRVRRYSLYRSLHLSTSSHCSSATQVSEYKRQTQISQARKVANHGMHRLHTFHKHVDERLDIAEQEDFVERFQFSVSERLVKSMPAIAAKLAGGHLEDICRGMMSTSAGRS